MTPCGHNLNQQSVGVSSVYLDIEKSTGRGIICVQIPFLQSCTIAHCEIITVILLALVSFVVMLCYDMLCYDMICYDML